MVFPGPIEVIAGGMFAGKTGELILRLTRAELARQTTAAFKHALDVRYAPDNLATHVAPRPSGRSTEHPAVPVSTPSAILSFLDRSALPSVVGIDEAQFFDNTLPDVCRQLSVWGVRVIVAGLDMDSEGAPFGSMGTMLAIADKVTKVHAVCMICGANATHTLYHGGAKQDQVLVGAHEYSARCRICWYTDRQ